MVCFGVIGVVISSCDDDSRKINSDEVPAPSKIGARINPSEARSKIRAREVTKSICSRIRQGEYISLVIENFRGLLVEQSRTEGISLAESGIRLFSEIRSDQEILIMGKVMINAFRDDSVAAASIILGGTEGSIQRELLAHFLNYYVESGDVGQLEKVYDSVPSGPTRSNVAQKMVWGYLKRDGEVAAINVMQGLVDPADVSFTLMQFVPLVVNGNGRGLSKDNLIDIQNLAKHSGYSAYKIELASLVDNTPDGR